MEEINMDKFEQKKNELKNFIDKYLKENLKSSGSNNNNIDIKKCEIKDDNNSDWNSNDLSETIMISKFVQNHVKKLKIYKTELYYLFKQDNDEKILNDIELIYYSLLFIDNQIDKLDDTYDSYPNCLYNDPTKKNENFNTILKYCTNEIQRNSINKDELVFSNLD